MESEKDWGGKNGETQTPSINESLEFMLCPCSFGLAFGANAPCPQINCSILKIPPFSSNTRPHPSSPVARCSRVANPSPTNKQIQKQARQPQPRGRLLHTQTNNEGSEKRKKCQRMRERKVKMMEEIRNGKPRVLNK